MAVGVQYAVLALFTGLLIVRIMNSLEWRLVHDTPLMHYAAFLMDKHHLVPYRDFFETSMPGSFIFHYAVVRLFGYGNTAFRLVDLAFLGILLSAAFFFMRRFGGLPATWSVVIFGLMYMYGGQALSLQRDFIGVMPVALALLCVPDRSDAGAAWWRFATAALCFGRACQTTPGDRASAVVRYPTRIPLDCSRAIAIRPAEVCFCDAGSVRTPPARRSHLASDCRRTRTLC